MAFALKTDALPAGATAAAFEACKTMYGGKRIAAGDRVFVFVGAAGLAAVGTVASATPVARRPGVQRQTPRVSIAVTGLRATRRALGRAELRPFDDWDDGRPQTELNFKFYRQATDKIVGLTDAAARFLEDFA